jgi:hypothetical protein
MAENQVRQAEKSASADGGGDRLEDGDSLSCCACCDVFFCLHDEAWVWTNIYSIRQLALAEEVVPGPQALTLFLHPGQLLVQFRLSGPSGDVGKRGDACVLTCS